MTAQELEERLLDYLYDELEPAERAAFEASVGAHPSIAAELEAHRRTRSAVATLKDPAPNPSGPAWEAMLGALSAEAETLPHQVPSIPTTAPSSGFTPAVAARGPASPAPAGPVVHLAPHPVRPVVVPLRPTGTAWRGWAVAAALVIAVGWGVLALRGGGDGAAGPGALTADGGLSSLGAARPVAPLAVAEASGPDLAGSSSLAQGEPEGRRPREGLEGLAAASSPAPSSGLAAPAPSSPSDLAAPAPVAQAEEVAAASIRTAESMTDRVGSKVVRLAAGSAPARGSRMLSSGSDGAAAGAGRSSGSAPGSSGPVEEAPAMQVAELAEEDANVARFAPAPPAAPASRQASGQSQVADLDRSEARAPSARAPAPSSGRSASGAPSAPGEATEDSRVATLWGNLGRALDRRDRAAAERALADLEAAQADAAALRKARAQVDALRAEAQQRQHKMKAAPSSPPATD